MAIVADRYHLILKCKVLCFHDLKVLGCRTLRAVIWPYVPCAACKAL